MSRTRESQYISAISAAISGLEKEGAGKTLRVTHFEAVGEGRLWVNEPAAGAAMDGFKIRVFAGFDGAEKAFVRAGFGFSGLCGGKTFREKQAA